MSSPSSGTPPPPPQQQAQVTVDGGGPITAIGLTGAFTVLAIIPVLFTIAFHAGAAYLSYKKYNSVGWAILNFFFAIFYYPYYAFFLSGDSTPTMSSYLGGPATGARRHRRR